ncbi:hypothetical protein DJ46_5846 (plasmid) [Bacillus anthracis str. Vollum]|uniref:Uncharacterized protein n=1 Tax=Bacillus anthracis TaxID=1392 RepID=Q6F028_BACAN|nr:hypothetical protein BX_B0077 [Bacillus anthracis str. A2012]AAT29007.2 hypothetical protein GBAA_pXO2_0077 [Bacillus anthracis str. 'Ames Ancestor']ACP12075.1 hypothetical protein BAMEG_B0083 [Bacillus anthracis str. CDC 684]ACQ45922.1 hypothetical protein BAA_B0083 [Bacillus anthracis str. A0248]ADK08320.1 conserved hypothetical protein [Bacillus cereus biovar anthracis str. CI]AIK55023.1 hypothetical protein DJ44_5839 [Bacillus anthracis]AIK60715.1 hypothetical protein DJ46_5846 [Bacill
MTITFDIKIKLTYILEHVKNINNFYLNQMHIRALNGQSSVYFPISES